MRGRTLSVTLAGLLVIPAYGASTVQAAAAPADDRTVHCPKASYYEDYTPCADGDFLLEPGATLLVHTTRSSDDITVADFAVFEPGGGPKFPIREVEYVELTPFKPLLTNQEKNTVLVKLRAKPSFAMDDGKSISAIVRVANASPGKAEAVPQKVLKASNPTKVVKQNTRVVVPVSDLASGKGDLRIGKLGEAKHGYLSTEQGRRQLVYKPFKNFKGVEKFQYSVNQYNPKNRSDKQTVLGVITFAVVK